jgi:SAM-dependent methyltransferase
LDIETALVYDAAVKPDFVWDGKNMPFDRNMFDCAIGTEVLEHCFEPEIILNEVYRVLKPGGVFFFTVPFLWNLHEVPHDAYRYTPFALEKKFQQSGFKEIKICSYGGWHSSMAQMLGLWVRRSPMNGILRGILSFLLMPLVWMLLKKDQNSFGHSDFKDGLMIPGIYGICKK